MLVRVRVLWAIDGRRTYLETSLRYLVVPRASMRLPWCWWATMRSHLVQKCVMLYFLSFLALELMPNVAMKSPVVAMLVRS